MFFMGKSSNIIPTKKKKKICIVHTFLVQPDPCFYIFLFLQKDFFQLKELEKIAPKEKGISMFCL